jgi:hypothetical protein
VQRIYKTCSLIQTVSRLHVVTVFSCLLKWMNQPWWQCHLTHISFSIAQTRFHLLSFLPINKTFCYIFPPNQALLAVLQNSTTFDSVLLRIQSLSYNLNVNSNPTRGHSYLTCFPVSSLFGLPFFFLFFCQWEFWMFLDFYSWLGTWFVIIY